MTNVMFYGYPVKDANELGLESYFKDNPDVAGMAWGGGENGSDPNLPRVLVSNPFNEYMSDPAKRDGLLKIEAARHIMTEKGYNPTFDIPKEQQAWRKGLGKYATNDLAFKQSIISRILAGDEVPNATKQQQDEAKKVQSMLEQQNAKGALQTIKDKLKQIQ